MTDVERIEDLSELDEERDAQFTPPHDSHAEEAVRLGRRVGAAPQYLITPLGDVYSCYRGQWKKRCPQVHSNGYLALYLSTDGKRHRVYIHQALADAFIGPKPTPRHEVRHLNDNRLDNRLANLAWGTRAENSADMVRNGRSRPGVRNAQARLTEDQVRDIRRRWALRERQRDIAATHGVSQRAVLFILKGQTWKHVA